MQEMSFFFCWSLILFFTSVILFTNKYSAVYFHVFFGPSHVSFVLWNPLQSCLWSELDKLTSASDSLKKKKKEYQSRCIYLVVPKRFLTDCRTMDIPFTYSMRVVVLLSVQTKVGEFHTVKKAVFYEQFTCTFNYKQKKRT